AGFQYFFATGHLWVGIELYPMTDIGGGIFSLIVTAIFLRFWKPRQEMHPGQASSPPPIAPGDVVAGGAHAAEATSARVILGPAAGPSGEPLTAGKIAVAWMPFALMSVFLMLTGLVRQMESKGPVKVAGIQTNYMIAVPWLHRQVERDPELL